MRTASQQSFLAHGDHTIRQRPQVGLPQREGMVAKVELPLMVQVEMEVPWRTSARDSNSACGHVRMITMIALTPVDTMGVPLRHAMM